MDFVFSLFTAFLSVNVFLQRCNLQFMLKPMMWKICHLLTLMMIFLT